MRSSMAKVYALFSAKLKSDGKKPPISQSEINKNEINKEEKVYPSLNPYHTLKSRKLIKEDGSNPFHDCKSIPEIEQLVLEHGKDNVLLMAVTPNAKGKIPCDLLMDISEELYNYGLNYTIPFQPLKHIHEEISSADTLAKFNPDPGSEMERTILMACKAANETRSTIRFSRTHPDYNGVASANECGIYSYPDNTDWQKMAQERCALVDDKRHAMGIIQAINQYHAGDCAEFSEFCADQMIKAGYTGPLELCGTTESGTHNFLLIGRDPASDPNDWRTWGSNAVICDAWSGNVFPASSIEKECMVMDYTADLVNDILHPIAVAFIPEVHKIKVKEKLPLVELEEKNENSDTNQLKPKP